MCILGCRATEPRLTGHVDTIEIWLMSVWGSTTSDWGMEQHENMWDRGHDYHCINIGRHIWPLWPLDLWSQVTLEHQIEIDVTYLENRWEMEVNCWTSRIPVQYMTVHLTLWYLTSDDLWGHLRIDVTHHENGDGNMFTIEKDWKVLYKNVSFITIL